MTTAIRATRFVLLAALAGGALALQPACTDEECKILLEGCDPEPRVCTLDEVNTSDCPFAVEIHALPSPGDPPPPTFDESSSADHHQLVTEEIDGVEVVVEDFVTPLEGEEAWALRSGVDEWWQHHPDHDRYARDGWFHDSNPPDPTADGLPDPGSSTPVPRYVTCDEAVPFSIEIPGQDEVEPEALLEDDCYALAFHTGRVVKDWLESTGSTDHVVVRFPAPCDPRPTITARTVDGREHEHAQPVRGPPPPTPHPNQVIAGRRYNHFTGAAARAWDAAATVQRNRNFHTEQLLNRHAAGATIDLPTDVVVFGSGPGGGMFLARYGNKASAFAPEIGWEMRPDYRVIQGRLRIDDLVPAGLPLREFLDTNNLRANAHPEPGTVLGYQPAFMDYILANGTRYHYQGQVKRYSLRGGKLVMEVEIVHPTLGRRAYTIVEQPGKTYIDASGMLDTPRVRQNNLDTSVPHRVPEPPLPFAGRALRDSGEVTRALNERNLNVGDTSRFTAADWAAKFNGQTVVVLGGGPAAMQTIGRLIKDTTAKIIHVHDPAEVMRLRGGTFDVGEVHDGVVAYDAGHARIEKRTTTARLSDLKEFDKLRLRMVKKDGVDEATMELHAIPGLVGTKPVTGDWVVSSVGPTDVTTHTAFDVNLLNTLRVVKLNVNGKDLPVYVTMGGGKLVLDDNASRKLAAYINDLESKGTMLMIDPATRADLMALNGKRGDLMREVNPTRRPPYEEVAIVDKMIYQHIAEGKTIFPRLLDPDQEAANDNVPRHRTRYEDARATLAAAASP